MEGVGRKNYRPGRLRLHILPILVWLGTVACVVMLFRYRTERFEVVGLAQGQVRQIAPPYDGRLKILCVQLFEKVSEGQTLAVLDDELINAQIAGLVAEKERITAELAFTGHRLLAEAAGRETSSFTAFRRLAVDVENARLRVLEIRTVLETDKILLEDLAVQVKITEDLLKQDAIAPRELESMKAQHDALAKKNEENEHLIKQAEQHLGQAEQRRTEFAQDLPPHPAVDSALEAIQKAIGAQEKLIDELVVQREALVLKSPLNGVVIELHPRQADAVFRRPGEGLLRRPGEVVLAGEPILAVAETTPREIIAYAGEQNLGRVLEGMKVRLIKQSDTKKVAGSQVVYLGPTVELMPQQLWQDSRVPQWGRPVLIKVPPGMELIPGELVGIKGL